MSKIVDLARQPGIPLEQWVDQEAAGRELERRNKRYSERQEEKDSLAEIPIGSNNHPK